MCFDIVRGCCRSWITGDPLYSWKAAHQLVTHMPISCHTTSMVYMSIVYTILESLFRETGNIVVQTTPPAGSRVEVLLPGAAQDFSGRLGHWDRKRIRRRCSLMPSRLAGRDPQHPSMWDMNDEWQMPHSDAFGKWPSASQASWKTTFLSRTEGTL